MSNSRPIPDLNLSTPNEKASQHKLRVGKFKIAIVLLLSVGFVKDLGLFGLVLAGLAKPLPVVVTRGNGDKERMEYQVGLKRSPALVKSFAIGAMRNLHTWVNVLPEKGQPPDPGILVGDTSQGSKRIPTIVFRYSLAMEDKFASEYRKSLAELIAASQLRDPSTQVAYKISETTEPIQLKNGYYQISLVGNLIKYMPGVTPTIIPFNKTVVLKAIPPFSLSEAMRKYPADANIASALTFITSDGLQITSITDYQPQ
jgi:hypothetical protein